MKHAYLIIAHSEYPILQILLSMLDEYGNDVYLLSSTYKCNFLGADNKQ